VAQAICWVPPASQTLQYDADGNLLNDGLWSYTWDGENRLLAIDCLVAGPTVQHLTFEYDWQGRRIRKVAKDASQATLTDTRYLYHGWNLIAEVNASAALVRSYTWGLDLSASLTARPSADVGGVGGLVIVNDVANDGRFPCYDGNGNLAAGFAGSPAATRCGSKIASKMLAKQSTTVRTPRDRRSGDCRKDRRGFSSLALFRDQ
jgi:hypothetical protein